MKYFPLWAAGLLVMLNAQAGQDFNCMQDCFSQGYARSHCVALCDNRPSPGGGMLDQPGLPKNPAFDQIEQGAARKQPMPAVADPKCMKDCQKKNYNYMLCQKQCSYSLYGH